MSEEKADASCEDYNNIQIKTEPEEIPLEINDCSGFGDIETFTPLLGLTLQEKDIGNSFDDIGEYYFESDHLALKGNIDYHNLLKTIALLQSQKMQAIKDIEKLKECLTEARSDPINFVNCLARKEDLNLPKSQPIAELPNIDWRKYAIGTKIPTFIKRYTVGRKSSTEGSSATDIPTRQMVRGRVYTETKPMTFNQLWSPEEQRRLEELLVEYPPEEIESRRWQKIATALGSRTTQQVASRVQKYFIKLTKAGLPVPGRIPSTSSIRKLHGGQRRNTTRQLMHLSSFFKHHAPPVYMTDNDDGSNCSFSSIDRTEEVASFAAGDVDEEFDAKLANTPEYRELIYLKKMRREKLKQGIVQHFGFKCDRCGTDPISGTRWHCTTCENDSVDLCEDCMECSYEFASHTADHNMEPVYEVQSSKPYLDRDYTHFMGGDYNYLDPNYMPSL